LHLPEIDSYAHIDSPLSRWDARVKLASLSVLLVAIVLAPTYPLALMGFAAALALLLLTRIPLRFVLVHVRWVMLFCLFLTAMLLLTGGGEAAWRLGPVGLSRRGLRLSGLVSLRALGAVLLIFPMAGTARFDVTLKALRRLRVPSVAVQILAFSYRYIFVLLEELRRMFIAARARGHEQAGTMRTMRNLASMVGMLLVRSVNRTGRVYRAMLARGYTGEVRTLDEFHLRPADVMKGLAVVGLAVVLLAAGARG